MVPQIWPTQEFIAPVSSCSLALGIFNRQPIAIPFAFVIAADFKRTLHPRTEIVIRGFKCQNQHIARTIAGFSELGFVALDQPSIRRVEACLTDRAHRRDSFFIVGEANGRRQSKGRPAVQPYPSLGDDSRSAFGTEKQTGQGSAPRLTWAAAALSVRRPA